MSGLHDWLSRLSDSQHFIYVKRLSANDTGATGAHQAGPYIPKSICQTLFPSLSARDARNPEVLLSPPGRRGAPGAAQPARTRQDVQRQRCYFPRSASFSDAAARFLRAGRKNDHQCGGEKNHPGPLRRRSPDKAVPAPPASGGRRRCGTPARGCRKSDRSRRCGKGRR
jgi:hypothetical protein